MFDPDMIGKEIRMQKYFGVPAGERALCLWCGRSTASYSLWPRKEVNDEPPEAPSQEFHQGETQINEDLCVSCKERKATRK